MSTINICMTSYPKRISNCTKVIQSVLDNTVLPDRIYLTLSHLEFPNWEKDIPEDLYKLIMTSDRVILNWVENNTKSFKKVFPVLQYLEDDDIIIDVDDDVVLPNDFIESRIRDFENNGKEHPISSNLNRTVNIDSLVVSAFSLFQKKMLKNYEQFQTEVVFNTCNDDRTYLYLIYMNGYVLKPCTKWCIGKTNGNVCPLPSPPHGNYKYLAGQQYDNELKGFIEILSDGKKINECFGLFLEQEKTKSRADIKVEKNAKKLSCDIQKSGVVGEICQPDISPQIAKIFQYNLKKPIKHDLVYVLGKGSKWNNMEIKISITSVLKFCSHWIGKIYVIGENPRINNNKVVHYYAPDVTKGNKDANIIHKILTAIWKIPDLSDNFLFCSDDILVTKKSDWEDFAPRYVFEYKQDDNFRNQLYLESKKNKWDTLLLNTLDRFLGMREHIYFYEPHIFAPINKKYFKEMCKQVDYLHRSNNIVMSLWFNWLNIDSPQKKFDHTSIFSKDIPDMKNLPRHVTYNDSAFNVREFREKLIDIVAIDEFK